MGTRGCFGMVLHRKNRKAAVPESLQCIIVEVDVGDFNVLVLEAFYGDGKPVVLRGDFNPPRGKVFYRLVCASMPEFQFVGSSPHSDPQKLNPEADSENRPVPQKLPDGFDWDAILFRPEVPSGTAVRQVDSQDHGLELALDNELIQLCRPALERRESVLVELPIRNVNRTVGAMLGSEVSRRYGEEGLPDETIQLRFTGSAGQSFGAWLAHGVTLHLEGDANDYVGKGLSGGRIIIEAHPIGPTVPKENIILGNTVLYGAISGDCYFNGGAGERFAVRNSGAHAVVEGVGDHGCEYMTGGRIAILGPTGRNFAAGMSGGIAYVYDPDGALGANLNSEMVELEDLDDEDLQWLQEMLQAHVDATDSAVGQRILSDWNNTVKHFAKVMPRDFKRVLKAIADAEERGADENETAEAIMAAANA